MGKEKKCLECGKPLTGIKTKYCGNICYKKEVREHLKLKRLNRRKKRPPRKCFICKTKFLPIRDDHKTCSKPCSKEYAKHLQNSRRYRTRSTPRVRPMDAVGGIKVIPIKPLKIELLSEATFNSSDKTKDAVLAYLKGGGKITKLPDEPRGKTPDVNIQYELSPEQIFGHGLEYELEQAGAYVG